MKSIIVNFVNTSVTDEDANTDTQEMNTEKDPFGDVNPDLEAQKYYRLNEKVFALPLQLSSVSGKPPDGSIIESLPEITFVGNIGVQIRPGKRNKKYFIDANDTANLTCPQQNCQRKFTSTKLLKAHIRKVHCADRNSFVCEYCGAGFGAKYLLERHSNVHEQRRVKCPVCDKVLSARTNLSTHLRTHTNSRPHACECGKRFVRMSALRRHQKYVHKPG